MSKQPNVFLLKLPSEVANFADLHSTDNSSYVKQHSPEWHVLRDSAMVTGSTLGKAISLQTLKQRKEYYQMKFKNKKQVISPELTKILDHGTENEVNIFLILSISHPCHLLFFPSSNLGCMLFLKSNFSLLSILDPWSSNTHWCSHACFLARLLQISGSWAQFHSRF